MAPVCILIFFLLDKISSVYFGKLCIELNPVRVWRFHWKFQEEFQLLLWCDLEVKYQGIIRPWRFCASKWKKTVISGVNHGRYFQTNFSHVSHVISCSSVKLWHSMKTFSRYQNNAIGLSFLYKYNQHIFQNQIAHCLIFWQSGKNGRGQIFKSDLERRNKKQHLRSLVVFTFTRKKPHHRWKKTVRFQDLSSILCCHFIHQLSTLNN